MGGISSCDDFVASLLFFFLLRGLVYVLIILHLHWLLVARDKSLTMFRAQEAHVNAGCLPLEVTSKIDENSPW